MMMSSRGNRMVANSKQQSASTKRNLSSLKQQQQQQQQLTRAALMMHAGASDGIDESFSSSSTSHSGSESALLQQHHQQRISNKGGNAIGNEVQYVNADGTILTLNNGQYQLARNQATRHQQQPQPQRLQPQYLDQQLSVDSSSPEPLYQQSKEQEFLSTKQQQHQRLQHQVHQQLQRIYGNAVELRPVQQQQQPQVQAQVQPVQKQQNTLANQQQTQQDRHQLMKKRHKQQLEQQLAEQIQQRQMTAMAVEQLGNQKAAAVASFADREQKFRSAMSKNQHLILSANQHQQQQQIEQPYDSLDSPEVPSHQQQQQVMAVNEPLYARGLPQPRGCPSIMEECNDDEDEDLLLPDIESNASSKRSFIERKNQLEDLHYATVTAAALLSATANAAAAFAATEKQQHQQQQQHKRSAKDSGRTVKLVDHHHQQVGNRQIYSGIDAPIYETRKVREQPAPILAQSRKQTSNQNASSRAPIYAVAMDPVGFVHAAANERRAKTHNAHVMQQSQIIYNPNQAQIYNIQPAAANYLQRQQRIHMMNNLPQLPARGRTQRQSGLMAVPTGHPLESLGGRQQQHHHYHQRNLLSSRALQNASIANQISTQQLALMGSRSGMGASQKQTGVSLRTDLLNRMLANNIQRADQKEPYIACGPSTNMDPAMPLVLDRNLKPLSFIERICRIDLTIFWWSLLFISFVFMGGIVFLSRYVL